MNLGQQATLDEEIAPSAGALTPAQRREVEIWFSQALDLSSDRRREYAKADELFRKCLGVDGGNVLVVRAYLENLARWRGRSGKSTWLGWWERRKVRRAKDASVLEQYVEEIEVLSREVDLGGLSVLASAAQELGWDLAEEAYLREILLRDGGHLSAHWRLSEICVGRADFRCAEAHLRAASSDGSFSDVVDCVNAVREPALAMAPSLSAEAHLDALEVGRGYAATNQFNAADQMLSRAQEASGNSLAIREAREDLQLAQLRFQFEALAKLEREKNALAAKARVSLHQKLMRLQLDVAGTRADRYPEDWGLRLSLVEQFVGVGNYFEALRRLKEPPPAPEGVLKARALRLMAETQQRLKRFEAAMELYRELLGSPSLGALPVGEQDRVRGQAERLAGAMGVDLRGQDYS